METPEQKFEKLRTTCWNNATTAFGMAYIFDKKAQRQGFYTNMLKVLGIVVPVTVGATATGYGIDSTLLKGVVTIAIPLMIIQLSFRDYPASIHIL